MCRVISSCDLGYEKMLGSPSIYITLVFCYPSEMCTGNSRFLLTDILF